MRERSLAPMEVSFPGLEIDSVISTGPVRAVYRAHHVVLNRPVLVVTLAEGILPSSPLARSLRSEAVARGRLEHQNIVHLHDFQETDERLWFVLEDAHAVTLATRAGEPLPWPVAAAIAAITARALASAHESGVPHGRLTTDDVGWTRDGALKLDGFGLVSLEPNDSEPLEWSQAGGTSPERTVGQPPTELGDVFSLGALLYEMLTGIAPFGPSSSSEYSTRVRNSAVPPVLAHVKDVPATLDLLTMQALRKLPSERIEGMEAFAERLENLLPEAAPALLANWVKNADDDPVRVSLVPHPERRSFPPEVVVWTRRVGTAAGFTVLGGAVALVAFEGPGPGWAPWKSRDAFVAAAPVLAPNEALAVRAVATPWAHVWVDGKHMETTPFSEPLLLTPGTHVVRFEHPNAPAEERKISGVAGQSLFLDVALRVQLPAPTTDVARTDDDTP